MQRIRLANEIKRGEQHAEDTSSALQAALRRIEELEQRVTQAEKALASSEAKAMEERVLQLLAERYHSLPTFSSWQVALPEDVSAVASVLSGVVVSVLTVGCDGSEEARRRAARERPRWEAMERRDAGVVAMHSLDYVAAKALFRAALVRQ